MGLLSFLRGSSRKAYAGKHARQENHDPVQAEIERTKEAIEERKRNSPRFCVEDSDNRTFEPPAPCGFSFDNVNYHHRVQGDKETGEILKEETWVDLREPNYSANLRNIIETLEVLDLAENEVSGFPSAAYRQLIEGAYASGHFKRKGRSMHYCSGFIKVLPPYCKRETQEIPDRMQYGVQRSNRCQRFPGSGYARQRASHGKVQQGRIYRSWRVHTMGRKGRLDHRFRP